MKFMLRFELNLATRDQAIARFKATGGMPPKGAKLVSRWLASDFSGGFILLESDDAKALSEYALMWTDLVPMKIVPVIDDPEVHEVLGRPRA
jgi:hypothetical protein